jgi:glutathione S-transferase
MEHDKDFQSFGRRLKTWKQISNHSADYKDRGTPKSYRYYEMEIDRPALPNLRAWYERLSQRTPYQAHVMTSFEELRNTNIN